MTLVAQRGQGHGGDSGVVAEEADERLGMSNQQRPSSTADEAEGRRDGEDACLPHPGGSGVAP